MNDHSAIPHLRHSGTSCGYTLWFHDFYQMRVLQLDLHFTKGIPPERPVRNSKNIIPAVTLLYYTFIPTCSGRTACGMSMGCPRDARGMPMECPRDAHTGCPRYSIACPWDAHTGCTRDARGMPTIFHSMPMGCIYGMHTGCTRDARAMPTECPRYSIACPWNAHTGCTYWMPTGCTYGMPTGCTRDARGMHAGCPRDAHGMGYPPYCM